MRGVTRSVGSLAVDHQFQLTRLMRGVTGGGATRRPSRAFQLTRLMRGVTVVLSVVTVFYFYFNSHASCEA